MFSKAILPVKSFVQMLIDQPITSVRDSQIHAVLIARATASWFSRSISTAITAISLTICARPRRAGSPC